MQIEWISDSKIEWLGEPQSTDPSSVAAVPGISKLSPSDLAALKRAADELRVPVDSLAAIMSIESVFDPHIVNADSGATGLIQFIPSTAIMLGTTVQDLRKMTFQQQLPYVVKFYKRNGCTGLPGVGDLYLCTFCPSLRRAADSEIVARQGEPSKSPCHSSASEDTVYRQNSGLDANKDGVITAGDVRRKVEGIIDRSPGRIQIDETVPPEGVASSKRSGFNWFIGGAIAAGAAVLAWKQGVFPL